MKPNNSTDESDKADYQNQAAFRDDETTDHASQEVKHTTESINPKKNTPPTHADDEIHAFEEDVAYFVNVLKESFESDDATYFLDDLNDTLYIELEGLDEYTEEEIAEIAEPIFEELDLDVEEIHLLPLSRRG